jgi:transposase
LVQLCFDFYMIEAKPENLIGDRAYDSDPLDEELRRDDVEMIAPHRANRIKTPTQDRRRLSRYMRRWLVERFFAWIQWQRRILVRWEFHTQNFLGFVQLACLVRSRHAIEFGVGPNGAYVGPHEYNEDRGNCRMIVTHRTNLFGEDVEVRRRICD